MNQIIIMGRMTRDPELRHTPAGVSVASFTLAVDRAFTPKDGERQTDFIDVVAWRNTGEFAAKHFAKGQMAAVVGTLQIRDWKDKDDNKRRSAEVIADRIHFCGDNKKSDGYTAPAHAYPPDVAGPPAPAIAPVQAVPQPAPATLAQQTVQQMAPGVAPVAPMHPAPAHAVPQMPPATLAPPAPPMQPPYAPPAAQPYVPPSGFAELEVDDGDLPF